MEVKAQATMSEKATDSTATEISCDLCILGAGISGLNALFAASCYLPRTARVVLVDRNASPGGMWHSTYDYVRLHQPYTLFTAGDIPWTLDKDPAYLASRPEIVQHLHHCVDVLRERVRLDERYGYEYVAHEERESDFDDVLVHCTSKNADAAPLRIRAKKLIKSFGFDVATKPALQLSSSRVISMSPNTHSILNLPPSDAPVFLVGGGKTAMDTAHGLISQNPRREVSIIDGQGVMFMCRDIVLPAGARRHWSGSPAVATFLDAASRYDGTNAKQTLEFFRDKYCLSLQPHPQRFNYGLLSRSECLTIKNGVHEVVRDYLVDVVDHSGRTELVLRSGERRPIQPGSWIINCSGYFFLNDTPYEPFVSPSGKVISIQPTSTLHLFSSCSAYLTVHLSYLNLLRALPLYELDMVALKRADRDALAITPMTLMLYNFSQIIPAVPKTVLDEFGTNHVRWYPPMRQLIDALRLMAYQKFHPTRLREALDVVHERFGVRCGPLPS